VSVSAADVGVNGKIYYECEHEPLSVSGPANIGCDSVVSGEPPYGGHSVQTLFVL